MYTVSRDRFPVPKSIATIVPSQNQIWPDILKLTLKSYCTFVR